MWLNQVSGEAFLLLVFSVCLIFLLNGFEVSCRGILFYDAFCSVFVEYALFLRLRNVCICVSVCINTINKIYQYK